MVRPIVMVLAGHEIHHGERDDSEMCLCGLPCYYQCPDWLAGNSTLGSMVVRLTESTAAPLAPERECPKPDTYFDGARWRCRACTWTSPRDEADRG